MSGFTGFIGETKNVAVVLENMMEKIIHRGPDSSSVFIDDEVALGLRRLHIEDDVAHQSLYNADESLVLLLDGSIYNLQELAEDLISKGHVLEKRTVNEVLFAGYEEYAEKLPGKLRGAFALIIWDRKKKKLFGARDMFGIKPFYYAHMKNTFFVGSEIKSFLPHIHFSKVFNEKALKPYLTFQYSVLNETFFKGVFKLPPAHFMTFEHGQMNIQRYWMPKFETTDQPLEEIVDEIDEVMRKSIQAHQINNAEEVGSFLSSGVDSSYVVSVLKPAKTFTIGFSNQNFSEIDNAKALTNIIGIENINKVLDPAACFEKLEEIQYMMDEPHSDPSIVPLYFLAELASDNVKAVFSGEGADELFGGYDEYDDTKLMKKYKKIPYFIRKTLGLLSKRLPEIRGKRFLIKASLPPEEWFIGQAKIFEEKELKFLNKLYNNAPTVKEIVKPYYDQVKDEENLTKMQYLDLHLWLVNDILLKADKMSKAHSLDVRMPFLDREVMNVATKVPTKFRINDIDTKYAFRLAAKRVLPEDYANRKKIGFPVPIRHWIREEKYYMKIKTCFESPEAWKFFDQQSIVYLLTQHYQGKANNGRKIWTIYVFLVWYKKYFG